MTDVLLVARSHLLTAIRERVTLFWFLVFPVFLLVVLSLVFGRIGEEGGISFDVAFVSFDRAAGGFSDTIEQVVEDLATPGEEGEKALLSLRRPDPDEDPAAFLDAAMVDVRRGRLAAIVAIPDGFDRSVRARLGPSATLDPSEDAPLTLYVSSGNAASGMAESILEQVFAGVDRAILARVGRFDESAVVPHRTTWVGSDEGETRYVDFLLPGIILMGFFTNGLFGIPGSILFSRDQRVLRRYWVTPLSVPRYLAGLSIGHLTLCVVQFAILSVVGRFALGASVSFAALDTALYLLLAAATFMAFGFLIASLVRTATAGMAVANILNMPMMFLSGLFFPIAGLPAFLTAIIYVNPVSYLADGLRASVGVESGVFSPILVIVVPLGWIAVSAAVAAWRLRWDVGR